MADRLEELRDFVPTVDADLQRLFPFEVQEVRDSGAGQGIYTVKGLASVYNKWSLDLGGFREKVAPGAFDRVLGEDPHVLHVWDHDTSKALSSTRSKDYPLELKSAKDGLEFYSRVAPTSYAMDLRTLLEGGVVDQSSFAFTVAKDEWRFVEEDDQERVERTILEVDGLFDVTTCAMGAYPQTTSTLAVRSLLSRNPEPRTTVYLNSTSGQGFTLSDAITASSTSFAGASGPALRRQESGAQPEETPAPEDAPEEVVDPVETPAAPEVDGQPDEPEAKPEDVEAKQRERSLWRDRRMAEYRRTREFAYGVNNRDEGDERS